MARPSFLDRIPPTSPGIMRRLSLSALACQVGILLTGSIVRVTGSGLGCPTWPQCFPGSLVPVSRPDIDVTRQWVEFGNRLVTIVLILVAGACWLAALNTRPRRKRLAWLAAAMPMGIVAQAVIGGVAVLVQLSWWSVMLHFLASTILIWLAVELVDESTAGGPVSHPVPRAIRGLIATSSAVLAVLLATGSLVTAAGPHAGDADTPRLGFGVQSMAQLHTDLVFAYAGMAVGLGFALAATDAPRRLKRRYTLLLAAVVAQGVLGAVQYALGVPEVLVALHVLGSGLVIAAAAGVWAATTHRPPPSPTDTEPADRPLAGASAA